MMKYTIALIAACAHAQDYTYEEVETQPSMISQLVEQNAEGQWTVVVPEIPTLSFTDVDEAVIDSWAADKEAAYEALNQKWADAWTGYVDAIQTPWNDFLTQAETLNREQDEMDIATMEEMINFIATNTFIDGASLSETFPSIKEYLHIAEQEALEQSSEMSLDALRINPVMLQSYYSNCYYDYYGYYTCDSSYDYYYEEETPVADAIKDFGHKISDAVITYGYEPEVVNQWLADQAHTMGEIQETYQQEQAHIIQETVAQSADYMKGILDTAVADIRVRVEERQSEVFGEVDSAVTEWKEMIDEATQAQLADIEDWLSRAEEAAADFSEMDISQITNSTDIDFDFANNTEWVSLAEVKVTKTKKSNKSFYAYGAATIGAAAGLAFYLNSKRQQKSQIDVDRQALIEAEEFVMV